MSEFANGACGECQTCGEPTEEEWHVFCSDCYREEQGWARPRRPSDAEVEASWQVCPGCNERRVLYPVAGGARVCADCMGMP